MMIMMMTEEVSTAITRVGVFWVFEHPRNRMENLTDKKQTYFRYLYSTQKVKGVIIYS